MSEEILIAKNFEDPEEQEIEIAAAPEGSETWSQPMKEFANKANTDPSTQTFEEKAFDEEVEFDTFIDKHKESSDTIFMEATKEANNVSQEDLDQTALEEHQEKFKHDTQKREIDKLESEDPHSLWWTIKKSTEKAKRLALMPAAGVMQMGENVLSTVGAIEEGSLHVPEAETTLEALLKGFPQAASFFVPATWAVKGPVAAIKIGSKLTSLFNSSKKLKKAQDVLTWAIAGAGTDALAFKKDDPNAANMLLFFDSISQSPMASHMLYTYLATKPEDYRDPTTGKLDPDSPAIARMKNVGSGGVGGVVIGAILKRLFSSMGLAYTKASTWINPQGAEELLGVDKSLAKEMEQLGKKFETETGVSLKDFEKATQDYVTEMLPLLKATFDQADEAGKKAILENLPQNIEASVKKEIENSLRSPLPKIGKTLTDPNPGLVKLLTKYYNGEKIETPDYYYMGKDKAGNPKQIPIIESFNLLKFRTTPEIKSLLQALSRVIDTKQLKNKDYLSQVQDVANLLGRPVDEVMDALGQNVANLEKAVGYVPAYKALTMMSLENVENAFKRFKNAKAGTDEYDIALSNRNAASAQLEQILQLGSRESHLASNLLRAHTETVGEALTKSKIVVQDDLFNASPHAEVSYTRTIDNIFNMSHRRTDEFLEEVVKLKVDLPGAATRRVKVKKGETKKGKRLTKKLNATQARIKRLEKRLADLKAGKRPKKGEPRLKTAKELELEDLIELELEKLTIPKEQRAIQLRFAQLTQQLKDLKAGKVTKTGFKELKTTEILELEKEVKQLKKRLKKPKTDAQKAEANIKRYREELNNLILTRKGKAPTTAKRTSTDVEKELVQEIKNQKQRLGWLKDKHGVTLEDLRELALQTATQEEAKVIGESLLTQIRMRLLAPKLSSWMKFRLISEEIFINGLLSSFKTPIVNGIGNNFGVGVTPIDKFMAASKGGGPVTHKESAIFAQQAMNAIPAQLKVFWRALRYGEGMEDARIKTDIQKPHTRYMSKELLQLSGWRGAAIDYISKITNLPGNLVTAMDIAYKGLTIAGEIPSLAYRKAVSEFMGKHSGLKPTNPNHLIEVDKRAKEIMDDLDAHPEIKEGAQTLAEKNTYTNDFATVEEQIITKNGVETREVPGKAAQLQQILARDRTGIIRGYLPFYRTPYQLMRTSVERTPGLNRLHDTLQKELNPKISSPEVVQMAKGRVAASNYLMGGAIFLAANGAITNGPPADPKLRARMEKAMGGKHWYTINLGFGPIPYARWDPIGMIFSEAAIIAQTMRSLRHLNGQQALDADGEPMNDDKRLSDAYTEMWNTSLISVQALLKDRHYLQSLMQSIAIFDEDVHVKRKWVNQLRLRYDPSLSFFSSIRRNIIKGHEAGKPITELPERMRSKWDPKTQRYTGEIGASAFEQSNRSIMNETTAAFDHFQKSIKGYGQFSGLEGPTITGRTLDQTQKVKNLMGETEFYPGTHYENENHIQPHEYIRNMVNSIVNIGATNIGLSESDSAVIRKLAELGSRMESPEQIKSFPVGRDSVTKKSFGAINLNTREWLFFREEWIRLNTEGNRLEREVRGSKYASPPANLGPEQVHTWWEQHIKKGGFSAAEQLLEIERTLRTNKDEARKNTIDRFPELASRMEFLKERGMENQREAPLIPSTGVYEQYKPQLAPLSPLP